MMSDDDCAEIFEMLTRDFPVAIDYLARNMHVHSLVLSYLTPEEFQILMSFGILCMDESGNRTVIDTKYCPLLQGFLEHDALEQVPSNDDILIEKVSGSTDVSPDDEDVHLFI